MHWFRLFGIGIKPKRHASDDEHHASKPSSARLPDSLPVIDQEHQIGLEKPDASSNGSKPIDAPNPLLDRIPTEEDVTYPEGGFEAWLVVFGCFCGLTAAMGLLNTIGVFQAYVSTNQLSNYSESAVGWIFSVFSFLAFFCGVQIGPIFDAKGPKMLVLLGSIMLVAAVMLLGLCTEYYHFMLAFGLVGGLGVSLIFTPGFSAMGHFFLVRRGTATGIGSLGGSVGGVVFPLMLQSLFPRVGFAWATRILGFIVLILCTVAFFLIRTRLPPKPGSSVKPDLGIFREAALALTTAGIFFMEWGIFIPIGYITSYALSTNALTPAFSYQLLAILNAGSFFGRGASGWLADKLGRFNTMIITLVLCLVSTLGLWLPAALLPTSAETAPAIKGLVVLYAVVFGFSSGSNVSLTPVCVGQLCHTSNYGRYYATCYTVVSFGTLTGIPVAGALLEICGGRYFGLIIFTGMSYAVSLVLFVCARAIKVGLRINVVY